MPPFEESALRIYSIQQLLALRPRVKSSADTTSMPEMQDWSEEEQQAFGDCKRWMKSLGTLALNQALSTPTQSHTHIYIYRLNNRCLKYSVLCFCHFPKHYPYMCIRQHKHNCFYHRLSTGKKGARYAAPAVPS